MSKLLVAAAFVPVFASVASAQTPMETSGTVPSQPQGRNTMSAIRAVTPTRSSRARAT